MSDPLEQIQKARPRRFRPYPEYKDSGVEWLGEIPARWDAPKMWQISRAASGGTPSKDERAYWDGEIPWVTQKDMKRRFIDSSGDRLTERAIAETGIKLVEPPVMLIVVRGMILAHSFPVAITTVPVTINQDMKAVRFASGIDPLFMAWVFEGVGKVVLAAIVEEAAHGTKAVRMDEWRSVKIPLPEDADEQRAIGAFLDRETAKIDGLVARKERLIELLQEKRTALITRAVTRGLDPNVPMKDSRVKWLGEIPAHWKCLALGYVTESRCDGPFGSGLKSEHYSEDGVRVVRLQNIGFAKFEGTDSAYIDDAYAQVLGDHSVRSGDLLIAGLGDERHGVGRACVAPPEIEPAMVKADCFRFRVKHERIVPEFAALQLSATASAAAMMANGATRSRMNLSTMATRKVALPPHPEQRAIAAFLDRETARIDALIAKVREAIHHLKEFRTALISAAVTGKIDVREEAP